MRVVFIGPLAAVLATGAAFAEELVRPVPVNPVVADYGENVLFYQSFDDGSSQPDIGIAKGQDVNVSITDDGFFGKGLASGEVRYWLNKQQEVVDFTRPGTMLAWVKTNYDLVTTNCFEPSFTYFVAHWGGEWKRLLGMKPCGAPWGHGSVCFYYERSTKNERERGSAGYAVRSAEWKAGAWRLFVATWTVDKLGFSVDGQPLHFGSYKTRLGPFSGSLSWMAGNGKKPFYTLDECVILDRLLTNEEIKSLYEKSLKARDCMEISTRSVGLKVGRVAPRPPHSKRNEISHCIANAARSGVRALPLQE